MVDRIFEDCSLSIVTQFGKYTKPKQSFRLLAMATCTDHIPLTAKQTSGMNFLSVNAFREPHVVIYDESNPTHLSVYSMPDTSDTKDASDSAATIEKPTLADIGLAMPTWEGFSGSSLRTDTTGDIIGITSIFIEASVSGPFNGINTQKMRHTIHHNLIPEIAKIHKMANDYYAAKEAQTKAKALQSKPYSPSDVDYRLWAF